MKKSSDFDEIWYITSDIEPGYSHVAKNRNFWNSRWRRPPSWKSLFLAITHRPVVRFRRNFVCGSRTAYRQRPYDKNCNFFLIQDGGRPPFWKSLYRHISVNNRPILIKFGTLHQILNPITVTWPKIEIFKFEMATAAILKIAFLAITH